MRKLSVITLFIALSLFFVLMGRETQLAEAQAGLPDFFMKALWTEGEMGGFAAFQKVADLDNDGSDEILICEDGFAFALRYDPSENPKKYIPFWYGEAFCQTITATDADNDGVQEIYMAAYGTTVVIYEFDGATSTYQRVRDITLPTPVGSIVRNLEFDDVDNDGTVEMVIFGSSRTLVYDFIANSIEWTIERGGWGSVGNIDEDGTLEIVLSGSGATYVYDPMLQTLEYTHPMGYGMIQLANMDEDAKEELVFRNPSTDQQVGVLDADTFTIKWRNGSAVEYHRIAEIDSTLPGLEVVANDFDLFDNTFNIFAYAGATGSLLWHEQYASGNGIGSAIVGDTDGNGSPNLWFVYTAVDGGRPIVENDLETREFDWIQRDENAPYAVAAGDLDANGTTEIVVISGSTRNYQGVGRYNVYDGTTLQWLYAVETTSAGAINPLRVGQLDNDAALEIVIADRNKVEVYDGLTRQQEWSSAALPFINTIEIHDIDNNGIAELFIGRTNGQIAVYRGISGVVVWTGGGSSQSISDFAIADVDNDTVLELAVLDTTSLRTYNTTNWTLEDQQSLPTGIAGYALSEGNFDETGSGEWIVAGYINPGNPTGHIAVYDGVSLNLQWDTSLTAGTAYQLLTGDINEDGSRELLLAGNRNDIPQSLANTGTLLAVWDYTQSGYSEVYTATHQYWGAVVSMDFVDRDNDGFDELLLGTTQLYQLRQLYEGSNATPTPTPSRTPSPTPSTIPPTATPTATPDSSLPVIEIAPNSISQLHTSPPQVTTATLTIQNTGGTTLTWTLLEPTSLPPLGGIIQDSDFEGGTPNNFWEESSTNFGTPLCTIARCGDGTGTGPAAGSWWAWFGGSHENEIGVLTQTVTLPEGGSAELRFRLQIPTRNADGYLSIRLDNTEIFHVTESSDGYGSYEEVIVDISAYADGEEHNLVLYGETISDNLVTSFFVDSIQVVPGCTALGETPWLTTSQTEGAIPMGGSATLTATFDSNGIPYGTYEAPLCFASNDPTRPIVNIPTTLAVPLPTSITLTELTAAPEFSYGMAMGIGMLIGVVLLIQQRRR